MALSGYEVVQEELHTDTGYVAKTVAAPTRKKVVGGGFRFVYDSGSADGVTIREVGPYGGALGDGTRWYAQVIASAAGTLRVYTVCVDA